MSFIDEIKNLVGLKAEEVVNETQPEETPEKVTVVTDEEKTAIVAEVMQILEPRLMAIEERLTTLEESMSTTSDAAEQASKLAAEAKEGVTVIAKYTGSNYVAPVAAFASESHKPSRVRTAKNL